MLRVPCSPLFKDKSMQNLRCLRWASLATFQVVSIPLNTTPFFPLQVLKLSPEEFASNLAIKRKGSEFFVIKMTGTLQRPVCYYHLCQLPLKWAQLPQPTNVLADERPFAKQCVLSPFCFAAKEVHGSVRAIAGTRLLPASAKVSPACRFLTGEGIEMGDQARHLLGKRHLRFQESLFHSFLSFSLFVKDQGRRRKLRKLAGLHCQLRPYCGPSSSCGTQ